MDKPINELTPAQQERLAFLQEQLGVTQQAIGNIQRWGFTRVDPSLGHDNQVTNRKLLENGIAGVICATGLMTKSNDLIKSSIEGATLRKTEDVVPTLTHQSEGVLTG
jgi:hypothetical protein